MKEQFIKHLNKIFSDYQKNDKILDFKEELLGSLMDKYEELKAGGLSEEESYNKSLKILDGIGETIKGMESEKAPETPVGKAGKLLLPVAAYWLTIVIVYLGASFITGAWDKTWMIMAAAALLFGAAASGLAFKLSRDKGAVKLQRIGLLGAVMSLSVIVFMLWSFYSAKSVWAYSWVTFIIGLLIWYIIDLAMRFMGKAKKKSVGTYDALIITGLAALIIYVLVSFLTGAWATSWLIFVAAALAAIIELMLFTYKKK